MRLEQSVQDLGEEDVRDDWLKIVRFGACAGVDYTRDALPHKNFSFQAMARMHPKSLQKIQVREELSELTTGSK